MTNLIRAEFTKLFTTRLWLWMLIGALGLTALFTSLTIGLAGQQGNTSPPLDTAEGQRALFGAAGSASVFTGILGIIAMTGEYRHQTVTPTFLATPRRGRVVLAKVIAYTLAGIGYGIANVATAVAIALPWLSAKNVDVSLARNGLPQTLLGVVAGIAIFTVVGVGLGALVRNQIAAVVGLLVYSFVIEAFISVLPHIRDYYKYFPGGAFNGLINNYQPNTELLAAWQAGLLLAAYGAIFAACGTALTVRRDIT